MSDAPQPPSYPAPSGPPPAASGGGKGLAIAALIAGIVAILLSLTVIGGILLGLVALVLGVIAARKAKRGEAGGRGMAITGIVLGVVGLLISVLVVAGLATFLNSDSGKSLTDCLEKAGDDTSAQQACQDEFARDLQN